MLGFEKMEGLRDSNPFRIAAPTISILHLLALSSLFFILLMTGLYCIASMAGKISDFRCWLLPILDNFARPFDFIGILGACWLAAVVIPLVRINRRLFTQIFLHTHAWSGGMVEAVSFIDGYARYFPYLSVFSTAVLLSKLQPSDI
jgi:hypothetical protein